ncbi:Right handed beta helix region [Mucilaginibacter mallensis]|uniref:Right handed beta helix region n=1 Tax=Mucilaginibacter mallensis TaxID=652787 RepID=A0A1H2BH42_MUCMA|nr:right-handed parallel beta-helix repeat-containing protein [Mucilaginibacter mallensis]SDT57561.1 Right handed beta helix region [Mucilaginibacter mallensis]
MKNRFSLLVTGLAFVAALASCSKNESTKNVTPVLPPSHPITAGNISGFVKGTLLAGSTYTVTSDLTVKKGDTLAAQPGAIVIVKGDAQITVDGVLQVLGTQTKPVYFNSDVQTPGSWGGLACDSAQAVTIKWAHIDNAGGPDPTGSPRKTVSVVSQIAVDIEDSWITNGQDDEISIRGAAKITILRNTIVSSGSTDGEAINIKDGATGDIAYNVVFSQAGTGVKLETNATVPFPQTIVNVYNNTLVSNGWRRGAAEPGRGVSIGVNAIGHVYNNIMVNDYQGFELFTDGDAKNTTYGNNLFFATAATFVDKTVTPTVTVNLAANFYPSDGVGKAQGTDLISVDPQFTSFTGSFVLPNGAANPNDFHLKTGSPAIGKGNTTYNADLGAYTSDGKGNKH